MCELGRANLLISYFTDGRTSSHAPRTTVSSSLLISWCLPDVQTLQVKTLQDKVIESTWSSHLMLHPHLPTRLIASSALTRHMDVSIFEARRCNERLHGINQISTLLPSVQHNREPRSPQIRWSWTGLGLAHIARQTGSFFPFQPVERWFSSSSDNRF